MQTIINFIKKYGSIITISLNALLLLCAFICCLTQVITKIGVFMGTCGLIGSGLTLIIYIWLWILEYGTTKGKEKE